MRPLNCLPLEQYQLRDAFLSQLQQNVQLFARERRPFSRALHFNESSVAGAYHIHVHFGLRVFVVLEIEQRRAVNDAHTNGGNFADDGSFLDPLFFQQSRAGNGERDVRTGDCRGARAAVCLQHIAIERDRALAQDAAI